MRRSLDRLWKLDHPPEGLFVAVDEIHRATPAELHELGRRSNTSFVKIVRLHLH